MTWWGWLLVFGLAAPWCVFLGWLLVGIILAVLEAWDRT
jgi:hypothetical protein